MAAAVLIFACVLFTTIGAYWLLLVRPERTKEETLKRRLSRAFTPKAKGAGVVQERERLSTMPALDAILARTGDVLAPLRLLLARSGVRTTVGVIILSTILLAFTGFALGQWFLRSIWVGLILACLVSPAPIIFLKVASDRRTRRFEELFPEAMDLLSRAMRAGHTFPTGLGMVAQEMPQPIAGEFRLLFDRQNYGAPLDEALREFAKRVPLLDARIFATAVLTQREAGGNLAEVLDNLANVIRRRFTVKRQIRTKTAHARMTGWALIGMPPGLVCVFLILDANYLRPLVEDPIGIRMVVTALVMQVIGTLIIRKLIQIDY